MKTLPLLSLVLLAGLALPTRALSNEFTGAVLYEHVDYRGGTLTLYPGEGIPFLSDYWLNSWDNWNDEVSSVAVWGNVVVYLYADSNYRGEVLEIRDHVDALGLWGWNDRVSSIWVDWAEPEGWFWDTTFDNWIWREPDGWLYHYQGLGWIYGAHYDAITFQGWFWDPKRGWLYAGPTMAGWFAAADGTFLYHYPGSHAPRWWYTEGTGWFSD
jgi:hypothetical protein